MSRIKPESKTEALDFVGKKLGNTSKEFYQFRALCNQNLVPESEVLEFYYPNFMGYKIREKKEEN